MVFEFKNLGIVESATIELKGLTIITGLNDTGKSFISKAIYSVIKTVYGSSEQAVNEKYEQISNLTNQIFSNHRQVVPFTQQKVQIFNPHELTRKIFASLENDSSNQEALKIIKDYTKSVLDDINQNQLSISPIRQNVIKRIEEFSGQISILLLDNINDDEKKFKIFFDKVVIQKLFQGQLNNLSSKEKDLEINLIEGVNELLKISVKDNKTQSFKLKSFLFIEDATIIETPTILQLAKFITTTLAFPSDLKKIYQQRSELPYPYYDLLEKMNLSGNIPDGHSEIFNDISKIIGGKLMFKIEENSFVFVKDNGVVIKSFNIATGIKSLGLIQLLLNSESINPKTILIIDEPEIHLHPTWEIQYAKLIVSLAKMGIPIVISSHSPYFLKALTIYVKEFNVEELTKVYFGEKKSGSSESYFRDVTDDLEPIFKKLAEPMQDLLFNA